MARKKDSPQKAALRQMMSNYMKDNGVKVKDGTDVNTIMRDMMSIILEGAVDEELDEELGYSRYDYRNKDTDNSRNGHSQKTLHTSYGDMELDIPRDRKGEFEPQIIKKYQNRLFFKVYPVMPPFPYITLLGNKNSFFFPLLVSNRNLPMLFLYSTNPNPDHFSLNHLVFPVINNQ